jgi:hypothetical protein
MLCLACYIQYGYAILHSYNTVVGTEQEGDGW